jgi:MYXO-CTERM domain-containing protein
VLLLGAAGHAQAFCRTRTCEFPRIDVPCPVDEVTGCSQDGAFVYWSSGCFPYAVQRDGSAAEGISALDVTALVDAGFRNWSRVACEGGGTPAITAESQGLIACDGVEYDCKEPAANSNLVVFRDDFANDSSGLRYGVIALTTLTANLTSGQLFDADLEINSRDEDFELGVTNRMNPQARNLRSVINHELGHLLGLSHSLELGALMFPAYDGRTEPSLDDRRGICEALDVGPTDPVCATVALGIDAGCVGSDTSCTVRRRVEDPGGCSCRVAGTAPQPLLGAWGWLALFGLFGRRWRLRSQTVL